MALTRGRWRAVARRGSEGVGRGMRWVGRGEGEEVVEGLEGELAGLLDVGSVDREVVEGREDR
jgi:hypothetical protein